MDVLLYNKPYIYAYVEKLYAELECATRIIEMLNQLNQASIDIEKKTYYLFAINKIEKICRNIRVVIRTMDEYQLDVHYTTAVFNEQIQEIRSSMPNI